MAVRLVFISLFMSISAFAYEANLNSDWKFKKIGSDLYGLDAALKAGAKEGRQVFDLDYDESGMECVSVPHCVNAHDSYDNRACDRGEAEFWRGWMLYRKTLRVPEGKHFFIEFETVRQSLYVYVNGRFAGFYEAGITASGYDLTPFVKPGEEALVAVVTENTGSRDTKCVSAEMKEKPGDWGGAGYQWAGTDFNPVQGGIVGNVKLHVKENDAYITLPLWNTLKTKGAYVWADNFDFAKGEADVHAEGECRLSDVDGRSSAAGSRMSCIRVTVAGQTFPGTLVSRPSSHAEKPILSASGRVKGLKFWSPDTPQVYDVKIELLDDGSRGRSPSHYDGGSRGRSPSHHDGGSRGRSPSRDGDCRVLDSVTVRTGFRHVSFDREKGLLINGKYFWLPGYAQRSTDSWAAIGYAPDWLQDFDAELIRESGARFVRWMHVAPKPGPVRAFDKAGVVCVCPAGDKESESSGRSWEQRTEAMEAAIIYFRNSPSVLFWEAGNNQISPSHMREMRLLKERLDPHGYRFMGCRTLSTPEQIAEAEYVGTMIHRHDAKASDAMAKTGRWLPVVETEYCREESPRRAWDRYSPPNYNFVCERLSSGAKQWMYNCYDMTQEDFALSNGGTSDGYGYFYGNRARGAGKLGKYYAACAMLCWTDCNQHGRNSSTENCRSSGRVDAVRIPKENFYVHQVMYSQTPKVKILGHWNYPKKTAENYWYNEKVDDGKVIAYTGKRKQRDPEHKTVYVIGSLSVDSVRLFVNGRQVGEAKSPSNLFDFTFPNVDVTESGKVEAVAYDKDGKVIARDVIETVGEAARLEMSVRTGPKGFLADGADIAMVDLRLVDAKGRVLPLASDRIDFKLSFSPTTQLPNHQTTKPLNHQTTRPIFMGGWNSGAFDDKSPVGKNWVNLECGIARVFIKAGRTPGKVGLKCKMESVKCKMGNGGGPRFSVAATIDLVSVAVKGGISAEMPQSFPANAKDYMEKNVTAPIRDLEGVAEKVQYKVFVNGVEVKFPKKHGAFKPDSQTGVVCPYVPVLAALTNAGVNVSFGYNPKKIPAGKKKYLRALSASPFRATLTMKVAGGKEIDAVAGLTVLFEDNGAEKNLTNFEMTGEKGVLCGELGPLLGYIPGLVVKTNDAKHHVEIKMEGER